MYSTHLMPRHGLLVDIRGAFRKVVHSEAHDVRAEQILHNVQHRGVRAELVHPFAAPEPVLHLPKQLEVGTDAGKWAVPPPIILNEGGWVQGTL